MATWGDVKNLTWGDLKSFTWGDALLLNLNQLMYLKDAKISENTKKQIGELCDELNKNETLPSQYKSSYEQLKKDFRNDVQFAISLISLAMDILSTFSGNTPPEINIQVNHIETLVIGASESLCNDNYDFLEKAQCECYQNKPESDIINP